MAREAIARLYDVEKKSIDYSKPDVKGKYDHGRITFRAKDGKLVDLDKIFESVWATRLSRGTNSALVDLEVTVAGEVTVEDGVTKLTVPGASDPFFLTVDAKADSDNGETSKFEQLKSALQRGDRVFRVTGRLEGWKGKWTQFLNQPRPKQHRLMVIDFQTAQGSSE